MLRVFIGYDQLEAISYHVASHSIMSRSTVPVSISSIQTKQLPYLRERDPKQTNDFSFSRFFVPWMCDYQGWALFVDCDVLVRDDITKLFGMADDRYSVMCVKHDYQSRFKVKALGKQTNYPRKNWSSVMLMNCAKCTALTPDYINSATGLELHRFKWLDDSEIGELPVEWNHLVSEYDSNPEAKLVHYTIGGPWYPEYKGCEFSGEWFDELLRAENATR
jgi:lipopolysaccharide biosynthesis glycosyltransferase